jgi:all-trans-retinol dehydrogenase (NAD+)
MYERNKGHIINISSASATLGVPGLAVYTATKWAVWGLTESLRMEAYNNNKKGVKYSTVHPSYIAQGMFAGAKLHGIGSFLVPLVKDHDVIAKVISIDILQKGRLSPKRPWTVNLTVRFRGLLPDSLFQKLIILMGVNKSMQSWYGRKK